MTHALTPWTQEYDERKYNIIRPSESFLTPSPLMQVYANVVQFDVENDTYPVDGGKRALAGRALAQIASGAGISFVNIARHDDGRDADVAEISVLAMMKRPDGSMISATGKKRVDCRTYVQQKYGANWQGNADATKMYNQMRKFVSERAETGAKNRAVRQLLAMKASYTKEELARPFVIPQIAVNMAEIVRDDFGRQMAIAQALGAVGQMYGGPVPSAFGALPPANGTSVNGAPAIGIAAPEHPSSAAASGVPESEETALVREVQALLDRKAHGLTDEQIQRTLAKDLAGLRAATAWLEAQPDRKHRDWTASEKQLKRLFAIAKNAGYDSDALHILVAAKYNGISSLEDLTRDQYEDLTGDEKKGISSWLEANPKTQEVANDGLPF